MLRHVLHRLTPLLVCILSYSAGALAQVMTIPSSGFGDIANVGMPLGLDLISSSQMTNNMFGVMTSLQNRGLGESASSSVSKLDLKAPGKARREYAKGYQLLMQKNLREAMEHLVRSTQLYPKFVAAHNALGTAYLDLQQNEKARDEFSQAVALDDHLPNSHLNLGIAQLALKDYSAAENSLQKASSIAPLDLTLQTATAYGELVNKDYPAVITTAKQVHRHKQNAPMIHYFAAAAWDAQKNRPMAEMELETLLKEDPDFPAAGLVRQILQGLKQRGTDAAGTQASTVQPAVSFEKTKEPTTEEASLQARKLLQDLKQKNEIEQAEAGEREPACAGCGNVAAPNTGTIATAAATGKVPNTGAGVLHASVNEVAIYFAATDHGKSVTNLTGSDIAIRDNQRAPAAMLGFRNEADLPLRLGLVLDISESVGSRFKFEQKAAIDFLQKTLVGNNDLAFVVGVNNGVLLLQDFTADQAAISRVIDNVVPSGGTALWDAVGFSAEKLASHTDPTPAARILVIISDGENNSSHISLREAIEHTQQGEVAVYTVCTRDFGNDNPAASLGEHALRTLSELTGGAAFVPGSIRWLNGSLADLQQVIRGRYLVAYRPDSFQRDGSYRPIEIKAEKDGHKLKVYARKGYYTSTEDAESSGVISETPRAN